MTPSTFYCGGQYRRVSTIPPLTTWEVTPEHSGRLTLEKARAHLLRVLLSHGEPHVAVAEVSKGLSRERVYTIIVQRTIKLAEVIS